MSSMNITKSKFMEYIRCNRYPALNNIHKRKKMDEALEDRYHDLLNTLENVTDDVFEEDFLEPDLSHLETMMPYFTEVEVLAAKKIMATFGGETKYSVNYGEQRLFMRDHDNFNLMCYVDVFNKNNGNINIIEVKATTSNKFLKMGCSKSKLLTLPFNVIGFSSMLKPIALAKFCKPP